MPMNGYTGDLTLLWRDYKSTGSNDLRNILVEHYFQLVERIAQRIWMRIHHSVELDDLVSAGIFGLMDAIEDFDLSRGIKFETYSDPRIRGSMLDDLRKDDWVPRGERQKAEFCNQGVPRMFQESAEEFRNVERCKKSSHFATFLDQMPGREKLPEEQWGDNFDELIDFLSEREQIILILYYREELTMKQIGEVLGLSEGRISQIHGGALQKIKYRLSTTANPHKYKGPKAFLTKYLNLEIGMIKRK